MKKVLIAVAFAACAAPAAASITVVTPGLAGFAVDTTVNNNSGAAITSISIDLSGTQSSEAGNPPLVFGGLGGMVGPAGGTSTLVGAAPTLVFGFTYTGFLTGLSHLFSWDPDTFLNPSYGAIVAELVGATVTAVAGGVDYSGVMVLDRQNDWVIADLQPAVIPVPGALLLLASGLAGFGVFARRRVSVA